MSPKLLKIIVAYGGLDWEWVTKDDPDANWIGILRQTDLYAMSRPFPIDLIEVNFRKWRVGIPKPIP
jgi:hypothetical protein